MKRNKKPTGSDAPAKVALIIALYVGAALISASGVMFAVYSFARNIQLSILGMSIPGYVVAMLMLFFGIRSFFSVRKLGQTILKNSLGFSLKFRQTRPVKSSSV